MPSSGYNGFVLPVTVVCRSRQEADEVMKLQAAFRRVFATRYVDQTKQEERRRIVDMVVGSQEMESLRLESPYFYAVLFGKGNCSSWIFLQWYVRHTSPQLSFTDDDEGLMLTRSSTELNVESSRGLKVLGMRSRF